MIARGAIEPLHFDWLEDSGVELFIKRDDLIHPFISGNKWRKLNPIIQLAEEKGVSHLHSIGGPYSNHLLALAAMSASKGMTCSAQVRGDMVRNHVLQLCSLWGMELEFVGRSRYQDLREVRELIFEDDGLFVPEGGNCKEGIQGASDFWQELPGSFDVISDAVGSGAGMLGMLQKKPKDVKLEAYLCAMDLSLVDTLQGAEIIADKRISRFGWFNEELMEASREFSGQTGILLDPIYTAKLWVMLSKRIKEGAYPKGTRILMIHSGGVTGWLSDKALQLY